jgi:ATP-GRASP peptide maturase of grasp-with-spasm system
MIKRPKKILIISKTSGEISTEDVIDWIMNLGHNCTRINGEDFEDFKSTSIMIHGNNLSINGYCLGNKFDALWVRRWSDYVSLNKIEQTFDSLIAPSLRIAITSSMWQDIGIIENFITSNINTKKTLASNSQTHGNKLNNLLLAKAHKLDIPDFILTTQKDILEDFYNSHNKKIITKDVGNAFSYMTNETIYTTYTELITDNEINIFPVRFFLSFFQEYIEKEFEIRVFILENKLYSMAIFSQKNKQTEIDSRKYDFKKPSRMVPYLLPKTIEKKLINLFISMRLTTGSVDLIKSKDNKYYFLEVNPDGQYGIVSETCNYNLNYEIAKYLSK